MSKYGVSGFPTIKYLKADSSAFGGFVGYMPTDQVIANMNGAVGG